MAGNGRGGVGSGKKTIAAKRARTAEHEAEVVSKGVGAITSGAMESEISYITAQLRADIPFGCMLATLMRVGTLKPLLTMKEDDAKTPVKKGDGPKRDKLRVAIKRLKHLRTNECTDILEKIAPHLVTTALLETYKGATSPKCRTDTASWGSP